MQFSDDVKKGLIAGAFGLAGTLIPVVLSWSRDRDVASTRQRKIDEATKRVAFWDQWLKLCSQVESPDCKTAAERVHKELALLGEIIQNDSLLAHNQISTQQEKSSAFTKQISTMPAWRRIFLLYWPERSLAWFPRLLFYTGIFSFFFFGAIQVSEFHNKDSSAFIGIFLFDFMAIVWCVIFRYLSRFLEQPHASATSGTTAIPPPPRV
jgi:hypothetical protein